MPNKSFVSRLIAIACVVVLVPSLAGGASSGPDFSSSEERRAWVLTTFLKDIEARWRFHNVPAADGRFLYDLVRETKRQQALEFGSANGYSAIWIGLGLEENGGRLDTVEIDPGRSKLCEKNVGQAGLKSVVNCINGDALKVSKTLDGKYDFFFIDLGVVEVLPFLESVESKLSDDAIILLHNIGFEGSYKKTLDYARQRGWAVEKGRPSDGHGYGFFVVRK